MGNLELEKAQKALNDFLRDHPELQKYQDEITRRLSKALTFENKMSILQLMMVERLSAMRDELTKLVDVAENQK